MFETLSESVLVVSKEYSCSEMRRKNWLFESFPGDCLESSTWDPAVDLQVRPTVNDHLTLNSSGP